MTKSTIQFLIALGILTGTLMAYGAAYHVLGTASAEVASLTQEVAAKKESASAAALAAKELERIAIQENAIRDYFVVTDDIVTFLEGLQAKGTALGTKVVVVSVSAEQKPRPHLELALRVEGSFDTVMRTVGAIEYSPYDLVVTNLTLDSVPPVDEESDVRWSANMKMQVGTASSTPATP